MVARPELRTRLAGEVWGLLLLACSLAFWAWHLAPELTIGQWPPNDGVLHIVASERLAASLGAGEPLLEPWASEWALGYPLWRTYQPLPHLVTALALRATATVADPAATFAALMYLLLVLLPVSIYAGARLLGLDPIAAGLASLFVHLPSATGEPGRYGLGLGSTTWRGSGLFTQLAALHLLALALGATARALDGAGRRWGAGLLLAATSLSHIVFGYVAFVSAAVVALVGPRGERARRLTRLGGIVAGALVLMLWFLVPLVLGRHEINHSRWEAAVKWDSFGASFVPGYKTIVTGTAAQVNHYITGFNVGKLRRQAATQPKVSIGIITFKLFIVFGHNIVNAIAAAGSIAA